MDPTRWFCLCRPLHQPCAPDVTADWKDNRQLIVWSQQKAERRRLVWYLLPTLRNMIIVDNNRFSHNDSSGNSPGLDSLCRYKYVFPVFLSNSWSAAGFIQSHFSVLCVVLCVCLCVYNFLWCFRITSDSISLISLIKRPLNPPPPPLSVCACVCACLCVLWDCSELMLEE